MIPERMIRAASGVAQSYLELGAFATAVPCARGHARLVVAEWGRPELADTAELVVSELVTNAVHAAVPSRDRGPVIPVVRLWLASDPQGVLIRVGDGSSQVPIRRAAGPDDDSGRGLVIVGSLSRDWGSYRTAEGKVVWALI